MDMIHMMMDMTQAHRRPRVARGSLPPSTASRHACPAHAHAQRTRARSPLYCAGSCHIMILHYITFCYFVLCCAALHCARPSHSCRIAGQPKRSTLYSIIYHHILSYHIICIIILYYIILYYIILYYIILYNIFWRLADAEGRQEGLVGHAEGRPHLPHYKIMMRKTTIINWSKEKADAGSVRRAAACRCATYDIMRCFV